jgi:hypothetical protein
MTFVLKQKSPIRLCVRSSALHPTIRLLGKLRPTRPRLRRQQNSVYSLRVQELLEVPNVLLSPPQRRLARAKREGQCQGVGFRKGVL